MDLRFGTMDFRTVRSTQSLPCLTFQWGKILCDSQHQKMEHTPHTEEARVYEVNIYVLKE